MAQAVGGTALVAGGAAVLNQVYERDTDALMRRTRRRPLPDHRVTPAMRTIFGVALAVGGLALLAFGANLCAALLAARDAGRCTWCVYTPMKRRSPMLHARRRRSGRTAAAHRLDGGPRIRRRSAAGRCLRIVFLWQIPHFMAIAWMYRDDYRSAGFPMLPVIEPMAVAPAVRRCSFAVALLPMSLAPSFVGLSGWIYFWIALVLGLALVGLAAQFSRDPFRERARGSCFSDRSRTCRCSGRR